MHLLWTPAPLRLALTRCDWHHQASSTKRRAVHYLNFFVAQRGHLCGWIWCRRGAGQATAEWEQAAEEITECSQCSVFAFGCASRWSGRQEGDWG